MDFTLFQKKKKKKKKRNLKLIKKKKKKKKIGISHCVKKKNRRSNDL